MYNNLLKSIDNIVWYIPIKKLRNSLRNYLNALIEYNQTIILNNEIIKKQNDMLLKGEKYTISKLPEKKILDNEKSDFIIRYNGINTNYNKKCVFYVGHSAGFFSEFNNMVLSIIYCLLHKIEFQLYSKTANFSNGIGWEEFFLPFCTQVYDDVNQFSNTRFKNYDIELQSYFDKQSIDSDYFTQDILPNARYKLKTNDDLYINELEINGNIKEVFGIIAKNIYRFNDTTKEEIKKLKNHINLPEKYYGFHIRRGDKITEAKLISETKYMNLISKYSSKGIKDIFISTDDYSIYENLVKNYGNKYNFYTLTNDRELGYDQYTFNKFDPEIKHNSFIEFFASIDILLNSEICIGSYTSNPSVFLGAVMPNDKFIEVNNVNFIDSILF